MGCLKLTYRTTLAIVKPAQGFLFYFPTVSEIAVLSSKEKTDAGIYRYDANQNNPDVTKGSIKANLMNSQANPNNDNKKRTIQGLI